jgi:hypothetical protein
LTCCLGAADSQTMGTLPLNVRIDKGWRSFVCEREKEKQVVSSSIRLSAQYEQPSSP